MPDDSKKTKAQLLEEIRELRQREAMFRARVEASSDWIWEVDAQGVYTYASPQIEAVLGYKPEEVVGKTPFDLMPPERAKRIARAFKELLEAGEPIVTLENVNLHRDGRRIVLETSGVPFCDEEGKITGYRGIDRDVTERKRTEERLSDSERSSRAWLEYSPVCTKIVDLDFNLQYMSTAGVEGLGIDDITPFYGKPYPFEFYPESFRNRMIENLERVKETGEIATQEAPTLDTEGNEAWFHSTLVPVKDDEGGIDYIVVVSVDTTERKRSEEERLTLERQVQHAQKLESLGVLAGGIAHDFNNILMTILGYADLALDELSPHAPVRESIQEIEKASKRAAGLAKQMLAYSGKGRFVIEPIDLNALVGEMAHLLEVSISKKAVLKYNFADNLPTFDGDATQIRQIIMNLITNGSEAVGDRSGVIALSTGAMDCDRAYLDEVDEILRAGLDEPLPEGLYTYFEVADTGCGMDAETIERIFDPFFTTKIAGRGLGMSAVLGIVRGHQGAINIYSEVGKGTTFKILFPVNEASENGVAIRRKDSAEGSGWRGSGTILIADDESTIRAVGKKILGRMGFSVLTAPDGREAVNLFREHAEETVCVLLDLTMPHLDGEQAFREIRRIRPETKIILCSGYNMQDATQRFAGKGLAAFLQKPYRMAALKEKLREVLGEDGGATQEG